MKDVSLHTIIFITDHQDVPVDQVAIETNIGQSGLSRAGLHHRRKGIYNIMQRHSHAVEPVYVEDKVDDALLCST